MVGRKTSITACGFVMVAALAVLLVAGGAGAVPVVEWEKTFASFSFYSIQKTSDGGYVLAGETKGNAWLIKMDENGNEQWNETYGGDAANSVRHTSDGGYILAGSTHNKAWLVKTDKNGNEQWNKTFGGNIAEKSGLNCTSASNRESSINGRYTTEFVECYYKGNANANSVQQTSDGGYIVGGSVMYGYHSEAAWLIKTDKNGNEQWNKTFGGEFSDWANSVLQTSDDGYILAGRYSYSDKNWEYDGWLIKTDQNGNEEWSKTFGEKDQGEIDSVLQTSDNAYILAGNDGPQDSTGPDVDTYQHAWLIKTDASGNEQWNKILDEASSFIEHVSIQQTLDGGYIIAGTTDDTSGPNYAWAIKTDTNGKQQWHEKFGHGLSRAFSVTQTSQEDYIIAGQVSDGNWSSWLTKVRDIDVSTTKSENSVSDVNKPAPGFEIFEVIFSVMILFILMRRLT